MIKFNFFDELYAREQGFPSSLMLFDTYEDLKKFLLDNFYFSDVHFFKKCVKLSSCPEFSKFTYVLCDSFIVGQAEKIDCAEIFPLI